MKTLSRTDVNKIFTKANFNIEERSRYWWQKVSNKCFNIYFVCRLHYFFCKNCNSHRPIEVFWPSLNYTRFWKLVDLWCQYTSIYIALKFNRIHPQSFLNWGVCLKLVISSLAADVYVPGSGELIDSPDNN